MFCFRQAIISPGAELEPHLDCACSVHEFMILATADATSAQDVSSLEAHCARASIFSESVSLTVLTPGSTIKIHIF